MSKKNSTLVLPGHTNDQRIGFHAPRGYMKRALAAPAFARKHTHVEDRNGRERDYFPDEETIAERAMAIRLEKYADLFAATERGVVDDDEGDAED